MTTPISSGKGPPNPPPKNPDGGEKPLQISWEVLEQAMRKPLVVERKLCKPSLAPGVLPEGANDWALDTPQCNQLYEYANAQGCYAGFMGYPRLAQLIQRSEYREPSATIASEMTRKWVKLASTEESDRVAELTDIMEAYDVRGMFQRCIERDGYFGRCQLFIALKGQENKVDVPLCIDQTGIKPGMLDGFRVIEPMWSTPQMYNSTDPTRADFYKPSSWYVQSKKIHSDRLLTFISREVPDLLKPSYNFGGLSLTQLIEPYVIQWLRTRDAVSDLIHNFSVLWLKTDLDTVLEGGDGAELFKRIQLFIANRDNRGLMAIDMNREEVGITNAPLASLDKLQAQAQEHLAGPTHIPLVKLWGITPAGLNANSDGEIRVFYDWIDAQWKAHYARHLKTVLDVLQLNRWGDIDESIRAIPEPLMQPSAVEQADIRKKNAETAQIYIDKGAIDRAEVREQLANDPESGYQNLPVDELPEDPMEAEMKMAAAMKPKSGAGSGAG